MPKAAHVHHCLQCGDAAHTWTHKSWGCDHGAEMTCPDAPHGQKGPS